ncbi:photosynthetic NDH subunit of lumenal location 1 [Citrus sinensis]|uniref:Photosynthetic NDH subunit of lumenal location 1 n=1 Tax=Citrus sinensis TaxID=2711 RepID=A0ACB8L3G3_CITSI|nr:photosynthetic NDH subunit of lumenal location 1 [Citrus sinensis]
MAVSSLSLNWVSTTLSKKLNVAYPNELTRSATAFSCQNFFTCPEDISSDEESKIPVRRFFSNSMSMLDKSKRRLLLMGAGLLTANLLPANSLFAQEIPKNYDAFVDRIDGYSYVYPSDWTEFEFTGHDSGFKDRYLQLQNVRVRFIPTNKKDVHDLGPMEEVVSNLARHVYAAPNQVADILDMQEKSVDGKNYYTFEYILTSPNYSSASIATIAIANGRYYTLIVGANERRWKRVRNKLKVVADSFRILDI